MGEILKTVSSSLDGQQVKKTWMASFTIGKLSAIFFYKTKTFFSLFQKSLEKQVVTTAEISARSAYGHIQ